MDSGPVPPSHLFSSTSPRTGLVCIVRANVHGVVSNGLLPLPIGIQHLMSSSRSSSAQALFNRQAELCLRFIIVGGGLSGLAVAYNLRKAGHSVLVLEKDDKVGKVRSIVVARHGFSWHVPIL